MLVSLNSLTDVSFGGLLYGSHGDILGTLYLSLGFGQSPRQVSGMVVYANEEFSYFLILADFPGVPLCPARSDVVSGCF